MSNDVGQDPGGRPFDSAPGLPRRHGQRDGTAGAVRLGTPLATLTRRDRLEGALHDLAATDLGRSLEAGVRWVGEQLELERGPVVGDEALPGLGVAAEVEGQGLGAGGVDVADPGHLPGV